MSGNRIEIDDDTYSVPLETDEQSAARSMLLDFARTGSFGEFKAGAAVPLGYGDFSATQQEQLGLSSLQKLLQGGIPTQYAMGDEALRDYLATDPTDVSAQFNPFKAQVERGMRESERALKRGAGFAGNLYSTNTIRGLGDIRARGNETMTAQLASLTNEALNRRLQAIPLAYQSGQVQQNATLQQVEASQTYGSLVRRLNDASIKARDAELLRRRSELQLPIQAAQAVSGSNVQFGTSTSGPSAYMQILGMIAQIGGTYAGSYAGAAGAKAGGGGEGGAGGGGGAGSGGF